MTKWNKDMPKRLLAIMKKGFSFEAACADLDITRVTGYKWCEIHKEFKSAKLKGEQAALKLLESYALASVSGVIPESLKKYGSKKINVTMVIFMLKTRFHEIYGDKTKVEHTTTPEPFIIEGTNGEKVKLGVKDKVKE